MRISAYSDQTAPKLTFIFIFSFAMYMIRFPTFTHTGDMRTLCRTHQQRDKATFTHVYRITTLIENSRYLRAWGYSHRFVSLRIIHALNCLCRWIKFCFNDNPKFSGSSSFACEGEISQGHTCESHSGVQLFQFLLHRWHHFLFIEQSQMLNVYVAYPLKHSESWKMYLSTVFAALFPTSP